MAGAIRCGPKPIAFGNTASVSALSASPIRAEVSMLDVFGLYTDR